DARVRVRRAHEHAIGLTGKIDVVEVAAAAGEKALVLDARSRLPDSELLHAAGLYSFVDEGGARRRRKASYCRRHSGRGYGAARERLPSAARAAARRARAPRRASRAEPPRVRAETACARITRCAGRPTVVPDKIAQRSYPPGPAREQESERRGSRDPRPSIPRMARRGRR